MAKVIDVPIRVHFDIDSTKLRETAEAMLTLADKLDAMGASVRAASERPDPGIPERKGTPSP